MCSNLVGAQYQTLYSTVKDVYEKLLSLGLRALVYNGDTDMACNFLGDQWFVEQLGYKVCVRYSVKTYIRLYTSLGISPLVLEMFNSTSPFQRIF